QDDSDSRLGAEPGMALAGADAPSDGPAHGADQLQRGEEQSDELADVSGSDRDVQLPQRPAAWRPAFEPGLHQLPREPRLVAEARSDGSASGAAQQRRLLREQRPV